MVGDGAVGKTSAILSYMVNKIPEDYQPTVADSFSVDITVDKENFTLEIFDTAGQEDFDRYNSFLHLTKMYDGFSEYENKIFL